MKMAFIGGGNMAEAILSAVIKNRLAAPADIAVSDIDTDRRTYIQQKYSTTVTSDNQAAIENKDLVILAVKPQILADVGAVLKGKLKPGQLVISILAGKSIETIGRSLGHDCIVRSMPNTPAQIGQGITVWTATTRVSEKQRQLAASILGAMGQEIYVDEERFLDMATAISGSGPAYVFLFLESLAAAAVNLGFDAETAQKLALQTLLGAGHLLQQSGKTPQELRRMVTSPGGTTAAAIAAFENGDFAGLVDKAIKAAYARALQLGG
ncbi:MAG: pyrroline-5-carboxylate reductase [Dehalococcoidales bacterium]|nr:pyrroline-5-carboxylate reductase [Dehalococcoidales bacterium]